MHLRIRPTIAVLAVSLVALSGCGGDEPSAADESTTATAPSEEASEPVDEIPSDIPSEIASLLPTDLPTDIPTDINLGDACPEVNQVLTDATAAMENLMSDPASAVDIFAQLSADLRTAAASSNPEVAAAAEQLATVYDTLATAMEGTGVPDMAVITEMTEAATALQQACAG